MPRNASNGATLRGFWRCGRPRSGGFPPDRL